jgi:hypothetical protein
MQKGWINFKIIWGFVYNNWNYFEVARNHSAF